MRRGGAVFLMLHEPSPPAHLSQAREEVRAIDDFRGACAVKGNVPVAFLFRKGNVDESLFHI